MKILGAYVLAAAVLGGGAIIADARSSSGGGGTGCGKCIGTTCTIGNYDSTCTSGVHDRRPWCASSSGCARRTLLGLCAPAGPL